MSHAAVEIVKQLRQAGYLAYWVGGCVRDIVMGRSPSDYDIATSATPDAVIQLFPQSLMVGAQFGVVIVPQDDHYYEVSTFRSEGTYSDGRRPDRVTYTADPRQDVERRDFTINALLYDPIEGTVFDYVNGQSDIQSRLIRTVGNPKRRFLEDKLRLLRAVRFAARFDFQLEKSTLETIHQLAGTVNQVSWERIRDELTKLLTQGYAARGIRLMDSCGLLQIILPEVTDLHGVAQPLEFHPEGDVWTHTLLMLEIMDQKAREEKAIPPGEQAVASRVDGSGDREHYPSPTLALGVLFHDIGKPSTFEQSDRIRFNNHPEVGARMAASISERLRFTNKQTVRITELVRDHLKFKDLPQMRSSTLKRFLRQDGFEEHLELHRLDCLGSHRRLEAWQFAREKMAEFSPEEIRPKPLLSGEDLIRLGYVPGPVFTKILKSVEDALLDNRIRTPKEAEEFVLSHYRQ